MSSSKPIIITGMHRSGTSLLTKILSKYIYFGSMQDINKESIYFQRINRWLLSCNSCSWDNPYSFNSINENELSVLTNQLQKNINKKIPNLIYFGIKNILYNKTFHNIESWGWKDPVNVFTLFLWSKVFSSFKVININRNPLDVSQSLLNRQLKLINFDKRYKTTTFFPSLVPLLSINKGNVYSSFKINNINDCLKLYQKYYNQMLLNDNMFDEILDIRYEDLLNDSYNEISKIYDFCEIKSNLINDDIKSINKSNLNKYQHSISEYNAELLNNLPDSI